MAALQTFDNIEEIYGIEIYKPYLYELKRTLLQYHLDHPESKKVKIHLFHQNIFNFDFTPVRQSFKDSEVLVLGNPPWATNSKLGRVKSENLPPKSNFKQLKGLEAMTGKSNFDIAEYISLQMIELLCNQKAHLALLLKNTAIKNIVYQQKDKLFPLDEISQYNIDAKKEFGVSVSASLLQLRFGNNKTPICQIKNFYTQQPQQTYGWLGDYFVADIIAYEQFRHFDGESPLKWRSGLKHDCAKVMELTIDNGNFINGFGSVVDIERELIYPLLKSSDVNNAQGYYTRKYVIVTQHSTAENTFLLQSKYPKAHRYLTKYAALLDDRKSKIYKNRPRFCLFGIGEYSFKKYKVIVSGLYSHANFALVKSLDGRPIMIDDTCYSLGFDNYKDAVLIQRILNYPDVQIFIRSLQFTDAKRPITKELLMRVDLCAAAKHIGHKKLKISSAELTQFICRLTGVLSD